MPPEVVLGHGVAEDPDGNRSADGVPAPALDQLAPVDIGQLEVDQDENRTPPVGENIGVMASEHVVDRHSVTAKLNQIKISYVGVVVTQSESSRPRHTRT